MVIRTITFETLAQAQQYHELFEIITDTRNGTYRKTYADLNDYEWDYFSKDPSKWIDILRLLMDWIIR